MVTRELIADDEPQYNKVVDHPLQSWEWGEFRKKTGVEVVRIGTFEKDKLLKAYQLSFHPVPYLPFTVGYFPKGPVPTDEMIASITKIAHKRNALFVKIEPNVLKKDLATSTPRQLIPSPKPLFTKYTFRLDLTQPEEELLKRMNQKTRYNVRLAQKHGVVIQEENTEEAFARYLELTHETTSRQGFYAHDDVYHTLMWETLAPRGIAHLLTARYQGKIIVTWIVFLFKDILYYPYGASSHEHKQVMASNLMMWETIRWGKLKGARTFDLWGTPGPDPKPTDSYYGFHKFKLGYGPELVEFAGTYDLVLLQPHYTLFQIADRIRWILLKIRARLPL